MRALVLAVHILSGGLGLLAGPLAMLARKRPLRGGRAWHRQIGLLYQGCVTGLCLSALGLVLFNPSVWWLALIAIGTQVAALVGWRSAPSRRGGDVGVHVTAMCSSYVSFVTAFLVVNFDGLLWWVLPTVVGSPLIAWSSRRAVIGYGVSHAAAGRSRRLRSPA